jgi:cobalt-zinc-cadmium efflux system membrane fusion protein
MRAIVLLIVLAAALGGAGCGKQDGAAGHTHGPGGDEHASEPEVKTAQITVWTNGYEVFAEHTPPVAGRGTRFITHISELQTGKPRGSGGVKFVLRQGTTSFEHPQAGPERPGIYIPAITFPKEGDWEAAVIIPSQGNEGNAMVNLGTVRVFPTEEAAAQAQFPEPAEGISFLKEQQWKLLLRSEPASPRTLVERVSVAAEVRSRPGSAAVVIAPLSGQLMSMGENKSLLPGARVEAGELLALVRPRFSEAAARFFETRAEFEAASAALKQAESAYERTKSLLEVEAKSRRELEEAEVALAAARARYSGAAALHANFSQAPGTNGAPPTIEIRAPIGGVVTMVAAGVGEPVAADATLFTILDLSRVWIEARVPESALARLGAAKDALCQLLDGSQRQFSISAEQGKLVFSGLEVEPQTRTVPLIYEIDNSNAALRRGQSVRLLIETDAARDDLAIPHSALVEEGGLFVVFVQVAGETFQRREVQLGIRDGQWIQVVSGLAAGERVVIDGAYAVRLASASSVIPSHGHAH